jgi:hypothetical protein
MIVTVRKRAARKSKKGAVHKDKTAKTFMWRHDGITSARFRAAGTAAETVGERLVFDYKVSMKVHGNFVAQPATDCISLHDMVVGDLSREDKAMHVAAVSDFMKHLLLTTPSLQAMEEKLESTGLDPFGVMSVDAVLERNRIYGKHV